MAGKALSNLSKDEETRLRAIQYEKRTTDYDRDMRGAKLLGRREGINEIAKKLKKSGHHSIAEIAELTSLSGEEIEKL